MTEPNNNITGKAPLPKALKMLHIDDNLHSNITDEIYKNPDFINSKRIRRSTTPIYNTDESDLYNTTTTNYDTIDTNESKRRKKTKNNHNSNSFIFSKEDLEIYKDWKLPNLINAANSLNGNISFLAKDIDDFPLTNENSNVKDYYPNAIKINYNPDKLLNFNTLINSSKNYNFTNLNHILNFNDFKINQSPDIFNLFFQSNNNDLPYNGAIKSKKDSSTTKTLPTLNDRIRFKKNIWKSSLANFINSNVLLTNQSNLSIDDFKKRLRKQPKRYLYHHNNNITNSTNVSLRKHHHNQSDNNNSSTNNNNSNNEKSSSIEYIHFHDFEIKTWYNTPYSEEYNNNKILYICDFCLKYMSSRYTFNRHKLKCNKYKPPGNEIYRDGKLSIWEVDARENIIYCQSLCLLAKLFLNSKTLYYDVESFIFYILTEREDSDDINIPNKFHLVAYFSQEKLSSTDYNLSCILTLPIYQRRGYGHFLMDFSYLLSRRSFKLGTPEKPLSDLGLLSYRNFWKIKCAQTLIKLKSYIDDMDDGDYFNITLEVISNLTGMIPVDVVFGLEQLKLLYKRVTHDGKIQYAIKIDSWDRIYKIYNDWDAKGYQKLNPDKLFWKPMIFGPSCGINAVGTMIETIDSNKKVPPVSTVDVSLTSNLSVHDHSTNVNLTTNSNDPNAVNTENIPNIQVDTFKKSIEQLTNFLKDDLEDPRSLEQITIDKLKSEPIISSSDLNHENWELCFIETKELSNYQNSLSTGRESSFNRARKKIRPKTPIRLIENSESENDDTPDDRESSNLTNLPISTDIDSISLTSSINSSS